jgi:HEAT repeat protein
MRIFVALATFVGCVIIAAAHTDGPPKKEDLPKFIKTLTSSPSPKDRAQAADDIGYLGAIRASYIEGAIDPLLKALKNDKDAAVRTACAKAVGGVAINADKCVPVLVDALKDSNILVKIAAAQALGQFGPEAKEALPALMELVKMKDSKDDKKVSQVAAAATKSITLKEKKK